MSDEPEARMWDEGSSRYDSGGHEVYFESAFASSEHLDRAPLLSEIRIYPSLPERKYGFGFGECRREQAWTQATLPIRNGGLGTRKISSVALPAFLSSIHSTLDLAVDRLGQHGLSCSSGADRLSRHATLNDILRRVSLVPTFPPLCSPRLYGAMASALTDVVDTLEDWPCAGVGRYLYRHPGGVLPNSNYQSCGAAVDARERLKVTKYSCLGAQYHFFAFGVETLGPWETYTDIPVAARAPGTHCHWDAPAEPRSAVRQLLLALVLCGLFMIAEVIGGFLAGSLSVMCDAAHMLSDCGGFALALLAFHCAKRQPDFHMSYGYKRAEVLGAMVSVLLIWILTGIFVYVAALRLHSGDYSIEPNAMMVVSGCGVAFNVVLAVVLHGCSDVDEDGITFNRQLTLINGWRNSPLQSRASDETRRELRRSARLCQERFPVHESEDIVANAISPRDCKQ
ncbi:hypothetical protein MSG28_013530 [Choristoneura fumiferana]|uniref:Uncharacterized protein n=1 Tax=Choristoneura fumiferana TaxID=7141 RepID=A0ACC0K8J8_CHOFU|nr:hypothetical protein MSG28_013530 [Choristoneura fumiferana]